MSRVLFVSHHFPPDTSIGSKRSRRIARELTRRGWRVDVLAAADLYADGHDPALLRGLEGVHVVRTQSLNPRQWWYRLRELRRAASRSSPTRLGSPTDSASAGARRRLVRGLGAALGQLEIPDSYVGWLPFATLAARSMPRPDLVLVTMPWQSSALVATLVARRFGCPLVLDYRDPWTTRRDEVTPRWRRRLERRMEAWCLAHSRGVTATTPGIAAQLAEHTEVPVGVVYNATDTDDFEGASPRRYEGPTLVYAGGIYGGRRIEPLLDAMVGAPARLRLHYMGASRAQVAAAVAARGLEDRALVQGPVPHREVVAAMLGARANVCIVGANHVRQVPGKLFEQLGCGRPVLLLAPPDSDAAAVIEGISGCARADAGDAAAIARVLSELPARSRPIGAPHGYSVRETIDVLEACLRGALATSVPGSRPDRPGARSPGTPAVKRRGRGRGVRGRRR